MPDAQSVWLLLETDVESGHSYVIEVFGDEARAQTDRKIRQKEEDEHGAYAKYRYTTELHWVR